MRTLLLVCYLLSADQADYDGEKLTFTGKFQLDHPMGRLQGQKGTLLHPQLNGTGKKGSHLSLEEGVTIQATQEKTPFTLTARKASCTLPPHTPLSIFPSQELYFYEDIAIQTVQDIHAQGGIALYKTGSLTLYPSVPTAHCQLFRENDQIDAKLIRFDLAKQSLACEQIQAILQYQGKQSFALAENLLYSPEEKTLVLSSAEPQRVLFWQEGLSLSAPEVHINLQDGQEIEGIGDVHFTLDLDEQHTLEKIFSKYL